MWHRAADVGSFPPLRAHDRRRPVADAPRCAARLPIAPLVLVQVVASARLVASPCALVNAASGHGWSAGMERLLRAHAERAAADGGPSVPPARRSLELNVRHPIVHELGRRARERAADPSVREHAQLLYGTALLDAGFGLEDPSDFTRRVHAVAARGLGLCAEGG